MSATQSPPAVAGRGPGRRRRSRGRRGRAPSERLLGGPSSWAMATADALQAGLPHEPGHPLPPYADALVPELSVYARRTVGAVGVLVDRADALCQRGVLALSLGGLTLTPRVVPAGGDL